MSKFKVGDKVRALANPSDKYFKAGEVFTVKEVFPGQETVSLVERGQCWNECRFELVEEAKPSSSEPQPTSFKVGDKVRRKAGDRAFCSWSEGDEVLTVSKVSTAYDQKQELQFEGVRHCWDGYRFELVEEVKPAAPVVPQLPGIPEGFRAVRVGTPKKGEWYVGGDDTVERGDGWQTAGGYVILEKIDQPAQVEPPKPVEPVKPAKRVAPVFNVGDKVRLVDNTNYERFTVGTVDRIVRKSADIPVNGDLLLFEGALSGSGGMFSYRFELVAESPDDLVIQDRVPAREGIDFGWWVSPEKFDSFTPAQNTKWGMNSCYAGKMHGFATDAGRSLLFVMCYRKDLPVLPTTEKVLLTEYVCWDDGGAKCIVWQDTDPTSPDVDYNVFDHAHPTGNTREVEVPIVKA